MITYENPIFFRERRAAVRRAHRLHWVRRTPGIVLVWVLPVLFVVALTSLGSSNTYDQLPGILGFTAMMSMYLQMLYLCFKGLVSGAGALAREREQQTLETLVSSPLPVARIVEGKFWAAAIPLLGEALLGFFLSLYVLVADMSRNFGGPREDPGMVIPFALLMLSLGAVMLSVAAGLVVSARAPNVTRATSPAVLIGVLAFFGTYAADVFISNWFFRNSDLWVPLFTLLNPYAALTSMVAFLCSFGSRGGGLAVTWEYGWAISTFLFFACSPLLVSLATHRFDRATRS